MGFVRVYCITSAGTSPPATRNQPEAVRVRRRISLVSWHVSAGLSRSFLTETPRGHAAKARNRGVPAEFAPRGLSPHVRCQGDVSPGAALAFETCSGREPTPSSRGSYQDGCHQVGRQGPEEAERLRRAFRGFYGGLCARGPMCHLNRHVAWRARLWRRVKRAKQGASMRYAIL